MKIDLSHKTIFRMGWCLSMCTTLSLALGLVPSVGGLARWLGSAALAERFPCEDHSCGCASASECWTDCCCFDDVDRLAWAMATGVQPPGDVLLADADLLAAARRFEPDARGQCIADLRKAPACGEARRAPALAPAASCCSTEADGVARGDGSTGPASTPSIARAPCKGVSTSILLAFCLVRLSDSAGADIHPGTGAPVWVSAERAPCERPLGVPTPPPRA